MTQLTSYALDEGVATITLDDGKVNALSAAMLQSIDADLDRAERDEAIVVLASGTKVLSAGFDLRTPPEGWPAMLTAGASLAERLLTFPRPTVAVTPGSAVAMGAFLLLAVDVRLGTDGPFKVGLNEAAIGMTMPWFGLALARHRLQRPFFDRCTITGELLDPATAVTAGFLDRVAAADALPAAVAQATAALAGLDVTAHHATKLRVREGMLAQLRDGIAAISDPDREP